MDRDGANVRRSAIDIQVAALQILRQLFGFADLDWAIFAILLVVLGMILLARELLRIHKTSVENPR